MTNKTAQGLLRLAAFSLLVGCALTFTVARVVHSGSQQRKRSAPTELTSADRQFLRQMLLAGVGSSVSLPPEGAQPGQVQASIASMKQFIKDRSGMELSPELTAKLGSIEQKTLDGNASRISCDDLSDSVLGVVIERFRHSTDAEIQKAADAFANVRTKGTGSSDGAAAANPVMLRANGQGVMTRADFLKYAKQYRTLMNVPSQLVALVGVVRPMVRQTFRSRLNTLSQALPEQWGDAPTRGLTPSRAFLLTYSVVSDDTLGRSNPDLKEKMKWADGVRAKADPAYTPSSTGSTGSTPYGSKGSLFSSPLELILNQPTSMLLLDKIAERTTK